jgi:hypothetical protein
MTASQIERFARAHLRCTDPDGSDSEQESVLRWRQDSDTGLLHLSARLTAADGAVVLQALRAVLGDLEHPHASHDGEPEHEHRALDLAGETRPAKLEVPVTGLAAALTELAADYLRGKITTAENADVYQVIIHATPEIIHGHGPAGGAGAAGADAPAGTGHAIAGNVPAGTSLPVCHPARQDRCHIEDGPSLRPLDAQMIACNATISAMTHDVGTGTVLNAGRRSRRATAAIRRAVRERDGARCAFWGCESRRTDLHHIQWWSHGGGTSAKNLLPACRFHHALIHRDRLLIARTRHGYTFTSPPPAWSSARRASSRSQPATSAPPTTRSSCPRPSARPAANASTSLMPSGSPSTAAARKPRSRRVSWTLLSRSATGGTCSRTDGAASCPALRANRPHRHSRRRRRGLPWRRVRLGNVRKGSSAAAIGKRPTRPSLE